MATNTRAQMEILVKATDQASGPLKQIAESTENLEKRAKGMSAAMQGALGALATYAGSQGLGMLVAASERAGLEIVQARFFLAGWNKEVDANLQALQKWAVGIQKAGIAGNGYATLVAAKLLPRVKDLSKAQGFANILLRAERTGLLNAQEAANLMIRATEGNERAMRMLLEQYGIAAPEFVSLQTLFEELARRTEEAEKAMTPFSSAMRQLRENLKSFAENAGAPLARFFATLIGIANAIIEKFPVVGTIIAGAMAVIATALAGLGIGLGLSSLLKLLGLSTAFGPWGLAIGAAIGFVVFYLSQLQTMSEDTKRVWQMIMTALVAAASIAAVAINAAFFLPLAAMFAALAIITSMSIEGYELSWKGFANYLRDTWEGIKIIAMETWGSLIQWLKDQFNAFVTWIGNKVSEVISSVSRAIAAVASLPSTVIGAAAGAVRSAASAVSGKRAAGGPVNAGASYLVGERGPEFFTPAVSGRILPAGGGGSIIVDFSGSVLLDRQAAVEIGDMIIKRFKELHRIGRL